MFADCRIVVLLLVVGTIAAETKSERTDRYGDPLPEGAIARMGTIRLRDREISQVGFSPDGKSLASCSWVGTLRVWDAATGKEVHVFAANQDYYGSFAFAPDSKAIVARGTDRKIRFWDLATGKLIRTFQTPDEVHKIAYSPSGKILAMIGGKTACLCDAATGNEIRAIPVPTEGYRSLAFSPDGKTLATGGAHRTDHMIWLWDVATGREIRTFRGQPREEKRFVQISPIHIYSVAFSPDGKLLASAGDDAVRLWDTASAKQLHVLAPEHQNWCVAFTPDGRAVASVERERIHLWETASGKEFRHFELPYGEVRSLDFSPDGKILAAGDLDRIRLWDTRTGQPIEADGAHASVVRSLAYSPDAKLLATGSDDKTVRLWDAATGKQVHILRGHRDHVTGVAFHPDGKTLASGSKDKTVRLWEVATGKPIRSRRFPEAGGPVAFSPNGKILAASGHGPPLIYRSIRFWDSMLEKELPIDLECNDDITSIAFAPNGKRVAAAGWHSYIQLWDMASGKASGVLRGHGSLGSIALSPDGRLMASGGHDDNTARLWDVESSKPIHVLRHNDSVWSVAISPDGTLLASGGWGLRVHLWDVLTGKEVHAFRGHRGAIFSLSFSPDGRTLTSGGRDTSCLVWDMAAPFRPELPTAGRLSDQERERLWSTLGRSDALAAWRAVYTLAADSDRTVASLDRHLKIPLMNPQQVRRWIANLDSDTFAVREAAQKELEQRVEVVAPALVQALQDKPSLEARKRMEHLLADMISRVPSGEYLATLRALVVLERIGTPSARRVLETIAQGNSLDRRTNTAKAALQRLAARRDKNP